MNNCMFNGYFGEDCIVKAERIDGEVRLLFGNMAELLFRIKDKQALDLCMQLTEVIKQIDAENASAKH